MIVFLSSRTHGRSNTLMARCSSMARQASDLLQRQLEVEHLAWVDPAVPDPIQQVGRIMPYGRRPAAYAHVPPKQVPHLKFHSMRSADPADHAFGPGGPQGLHHGIAGAHTLQDGVGAYALGEFPDPGNARLTPLGDGVGGAELRGELLAR
jgi:hypothetical protein